jgi:hypothetical protein
MRPAPGLTYSGTGCTNGLSFSTMNVATIVDFSGPFAYAVRRLGGI